MTERDEAMEITREQIRDASGADLDGLVELRVYNDDLTANTDDRLDDALISAPEWEITCDEEGELEQAGANVHAALWYMEVWKHRAALNPDKRAKLEAHVAAYRAKPRAFTSDPAMLAVLKEEMLKRCRCADMTWHKDFTEGQFIVSFTTLEYKEACMRGETEADAWSRAACLACEPVTAITDSEKRAAKDAAGG